MEKIESIECLRFPMALFIVMTHTFPESNVNDYVFYRFFDAFLRDNSLPVFFFISGYLFFQPARQFTTAVWRKKLRSRIHTLLVPYIIWNTFAILLLLLAVKCGMSRYMATAGEINLTPSSILNCFWTYNGSLIGAYTPSSYPVNVPLWYVRDLMIMCLAAPLIHWAVRRSPILCCAVCASVWVAFSSFGLFFFTLGCYIATSYNTTLFSGKKWTFCSVAVYIGTGVVLFFINNDANYQIYYLLRQLNMAAFLPLSFYLANYGGKLRRLLVQAAPFSTILFFAHQPLCGKINKIILSSFQPQSQLLTVTVNITAIIITIAAIAAFALILDRRCPKVLYLLTGRKTIMNNKTTAI